MSAAANWLGRAWISACLASAWAGFPAEVCAKCGEEVFTEETSARIDELAKEKGLFGLAARTTVGKSGDSLDIRINRKIAEFANLQKGQTVIVHPEGRNRIVITF